MIERLELGRYAQQLSDSLPIGGSARVFRVGWRRNLRPWHHRLDEPLDAPVRRIGDVRIVAWRWLTGSAARQSAPIVEPVIRRSSLLHRNAGALKKSACDRPTTGRTSSRETYMSTTPKTADAHLRLLADGNQIPLLGLGVWQVPNGPTCVNAVRWALELGYRHIDTAQVYGNEESVGVALRESGVPRDQVFITTKFNPSRKDPAAEAERSMQRLGTDYVDLYLVHWPQGGATRAWTGMPRACELGYARSIGVSNFGLPGLDQLQVVAPMPPVVDQVHFSPFEYLRALLGGAQPGTIFFG